MLSHQTSMMRHKSIAGRYSHAWHECSASFDQASYLTHGKLNLLYSFLSLKDLWASASQTALIWDMYIVVTHHVACSTFQIKEVLLACSNASLEGFS